MNKEVLQIKRDILYKMNCAIKDYLRFMFEHNKQYELIYYAVYVNLKHLLINIDLDLYEKIMNIEPEKIEPFFYERLLEQINKEILEN